MGGGTFGVPYTPRGRKPIFLKKNGNLFLGYFGPLGIYCLRGVPRKSPGFIQLFALLHHHDLLLALFGCKLPCNEYVSGPFCSAASSWPSFGSFWMQVALQCRASSHP